MPTQNDFNNAYRLGSLQAIYACGLTKVAGPIGSLLENQAVQRALIGGGVGGVVGGATDIGAGRGALAGAAAGAGSSYAGQFGGRLLGQNLAKDLQVARQAGRAAGARGVSSAATSSQKMIEDVANKYGLGTPAWGKNLSNARLAGGALGGALGAGGTLALTNPPKKHWYE